MAARGTVPAVSAVPSVSAVSAVPTVSTVPAVSVVMPVYNMERFLGGTVESVLGQTLADLELICVDDGSTDRSLTMLNEYAARDDRVTVVAQANAGISAARNAGWAQSTGRYLYFMDADDILEPHALATLVERCDADGLDLLRFNMVAFADSPDMLATAEAEMARWSVASDEIGIVAGGALLEYLVNGGAYSPVTWLYLLRSEVVQLQPPFLECVRYHEDAIFTPHVFLAARRAACTPEALIQRRVRAGSLGKGSRADGDLSDRLHLLRSMSELAASERAAGHPAYVKPHVLSRLNQVPTAWRMLGPEGARRAVAERPENAVLGPALAEVVRIDDRIAQARARVDRAVATNRAIERNPVLHMVARVWGIALRGARRGV